MRRTRVANHQLFARAAAAVLVATVAGCGHTVAVGGSGTLRLALTEYRVVPQRVQAAPGQLTLIVVNDGRLTHNLAITIGSRIVGQTPPIPPGESTDLFVTLGRGSYLMTSTLFSDQALGEYGTLTVGS